MRAMRRLPHAFAALAALAFFACAGSISSSRPSELPEITRPQPSFGFFGDTIRARGLRLRSGGLRKHDRLRGRRNDGTRTFERRHEAHDLRADPRLLGSVILFNSRGTSLPRPVSSTRAGPPFRGTQVARILLHRPPSVARWRPPVLPSTSFHSPVDLGRRTDQARDGPPLVQPLGRRRDLMRGFTAGSRTASWRSILRPGYRRALGRSWRRLLLRPLPKTLAIHGFQRGPRRSRLHPRDCVHAKRRHVTPHPRRIIYGEWVLGITALPGALARLIRIEPNGDGRLVGGSSA